MFFTSWCVYKMTVFVWHRDYLEHFDIVSKNVDSVHLVLFPAILRVKKEPETVFCHMKPLMTKQLRNSSLEHMLGCIVSLQIHVHPEPQNLGTRSLQI